MSDQRIAAKTVKHLGKIGVHSGPLPCREHDGDRLHGENLSRKLGEPAPLLRRVEAVEHGFVRQRRRVDALDGLETVGGDLGVIDNVSLPTADAEDLGDGTPAVGGTVQIYGNL